ncbi:uncharacterized protein UTRI_04227 [Ustilago trichophora]|uniref:Uncharacterized protein n=1 Tax=Ustilago trichophora TaxID=86804 RepID=A0A5C3EPH9_9BASI|nr:uncharacterized protein UTRI_04227 [Ustilago trichophora]
MSKKAELAGWKGYEVRLMVFRGGRVARELRDAAKSGLDCKYPVGIDRRLEGIESDGTYPRDELASGSDGAGREWLRLDQDESCSVAKEGPSKMRTQRWSELSCRVGVDAGDGGG